MSLLPLKTFLARPRRPRPWLLACGIALVALIGLALAGADLASLQETHAEISEQISEQSATLSEARGANAAMRIQIQGVREAIAAQEEVLSSSKGMLP